MDERPPDGHPPGLSLSAVAVGNRIFAIGGHGKFPGNLTAHEVLGPIASSRQCSFAASTSGLVGGTVTEAPDRGELAVASGLNPTDQIGDGCENQLNNGGFEEPKLPAGRRYDDRLPANAVPGWTLSRGRSMEFQRDVFGAGAAKEGTQYLEIASTGPTTMHQEVAVTKGETYELRGFYAPRPRVASNDIGIALHSGRSDVRWTLAANGEASNGAPLEWQEFTLQIVADDDVLTVAFRDQGAPDAAGGFLDGIRLCRRPR